MLHREIIAVCSEIHTKHINTLCGQNVEFVSALTVVHVVTTALNATRYRNITSSTSETDFTPSLTNCESNFKNESELISFDIRLQFGASVISLSFGETGNYLGEVAVKVRNTSTGVLSEGRGVVVVVVLVLVVVVGVVVVRGMG